MRWTVELADGGVLENLTTGQLMSYRKFNLICFERLNRLYSPMKPAAWDAELQRVTVEEFAR